MAESVNSEAIRVEPPTPAERIMFLVGRAIDEAYAEGRQFERDSRTCDGNTCAARPYIQAVRKLLSEHMEQR